MTLPIAERLRKPMWAIDQQGQKLDGPPLLNPDGLKAADIIEQLYEALKNTTEDLRDLANDHSLAVAPETWSLLSRAEEVLAKARGEQP